MSTVNSVDAALPLLGLPGLRNGEQRVAGQPRSLIQVVFARGGSPETCCTFARPPCLGVGISEISSLALAWVLRGFDLDIDNEYTQLCTNSENYWPAKNSALPLTSTRILW